MDTNRTKWMRSSAALGLCLGAAMLCWHSLAIDTAPATTMRVETGTGPSIAAPGDGEPRAAAPATPVAGFYGAPVGMAMRHEWEASTTMSLQSLHGDASRMQVDLAGTMTITVLARAGDELVAELVFPVVEGWLTTTANRVPVTRDSALSSDLGRAAVIRMRADGETLGYRFADGVAAEHRNLVRGLWTSLRFSPRTEEAGTWAASEQDLLGATTVEYRWLRPTVAAGRVLGGTLQKRRLGHAAAGASSSDELRGTGDGEAFFNPEVGWFERAHWQEGTRREVHDAGLTVVASLRMDTRLVDTGWRDVGEEAGLWSGAWQQVATEASADPDARETERQRRRLEGVTVEQLLADLAALAQRGESDGEVGQGKHFDLAWLLRTQPAAMARLQQLLPGLDPALAQAALAAMGATQMPAAQAVLGELFADGSQPRSLRLAAAMAMVQVEHPTAEVVKRFVTSFEGDGAFDAAGAAGMLVLGTMTGRSEAGVQAAALRSLLGLEAVARRHGAIGGWLEALGNSGVDASLAAAERYRNDADPSVRLAAISAVRSVRGAGAARFAAAGLQDAEPAVRARAAEVLAQRGEAGALQALATLLRNEPDKRVRATAVAALSMRVGEPAVAALLREVAAGDPEADVRSAAGRALAAG